jgi:predicted PurR-regulated permease PerM
MALPARNQVVIWGVAFAVLVLALWALGGTLLPFIAGAAVAYFLDPVADRLQRLGLGRVWAVAVISVSVTLVVLLGLLVAIPAILVQGQALAEALPGYIAQLQDFVAARLPARLVDPETLQRALEGAQDSLRDGALVVLNTALASSMKVIDFVMVALVTPVVAIYLLLDWDRMVARIDGWLPRQHARVIRRLAREIDRVLAGFVRGQVTVCLILAVYYGGALALIGLPSGLFVGIVTGLISFIPFVGAILGGVLSIGIALFTFWGAPVWILATLGIFVLGQFIEGNILQPKLVGGSVGLHPVWLLLALSVFGALFGFAGLLIAVPLAAALGVLFRFALEQYLESPLYTGRPRKPRPPAEERLMEVSGE